MSLGFLMQKREELGRRRCESMSNESKHESDVEASLPHIQIAEGTSINLDNETEIVSIHVHDAHEDGDAMVFFPTENILHTGNIFFSREYKGKVQGQIKAIRYALSIANEKTKIIPGCGRVIGKDELIRYLDLLKSIKDRVAEASNDGHSLQEVRRLNLASEWDSQQGLSKIPADDLVVCIFESNESISLK